MNKDFLFFGDPRNKQLSENLARELVTKVNYPEVTVFPDGEVRFRILQDVHDKRIVLLKTLGAPVAETILEFLFTVDALKQSGAMSILAVVPYVAYSRADHIFRVGEGVPLEVVSRLIDSSGIDKLLLVDPHSIKTPEIFHVKTYDLSAIPIFASKIKELEPNNENITLITPDMGGIRRIKLLSEALGGVEFAVVNKERDLESGDVKAVNLEGKINRTAFIVDDIISTGKTIKEAIEIVKKHGARHIYVMATHPVFSGDATKLLQDSDAHNIFVTDSIEIPDSKKFEKLQILSLAALLSKEIKELE